MSTNPDNRLSDDEIAEETSRHLLRWSIIGLVVFAVLWWMYFDSIAMNVKGWWGRRYIPEVRRFMAAEDWTNAARTLNDANRWAPQDLDVLRVAVEFVEKTGSEPRTMIRFLSQLDAKGALTPEEVSKLGQAYVNLPDIKKAHDTYDRYQPEQLTKRPALELLAAIQKAEGLAARSFLTQRQALLADPENPDAVLDLALLDARSGDPSLSGPARERLWPIARSGGDQAVPAIEFLAQHRQLTAQDASDLMILVESIKDRPKAVTCRFAVLSANLRLHPHEREQIVNEELRRWNGRAAAHLPPLLDWLVKEKEFERVLLLVSDKTAANYSALLPNYVSALRGLSRWGELKVFLSGRLDPSFPAVQARIWLAEAESHLSDDPTTPRHLLSTVFDETGRGENMSAALKSAEMAEFLGYWDLSRRFFEGVARKHAAAAQSMYLKVYEMAQKETNGAAMLRSSEELLRLKPTDVVYLDRASYLRLILGTDIEIAVKDLNATKDVPAHHITPDRHVALAFLRALAAFREARYNDIAPELARVKSYDTFPAGARAVYAGLLAITGNQSGAFQIAEKVPVNLLLPEERRFLARAL
ncbi:MAG: tetratricopeptide repeat protein [Prosthecobacter sp.]